MENWDHVACCQHTVQSQAGMGDTVVWKPQPLVSLVLKHPLKLKVKISSSFSCSLSGVTCLYLTLVLASSSAHAQTLSPSPIHLSEFNFFTLFADLCLLLFKLLTSFRVSYHFLKTSSCEPNAYAWDCSEILESSCFFHACDEPQFSLYFLIAYKLWVLYIKAGQGQPMRKKRGFQGCKS